MSDDSAEKKDDAATPADSGEAAQSESGEPQSGDQPSQPAPPSLEQRIAELREEASRNKDKMLRVAADFENYRKRTSRELDDVKRRARQSTLKDLLPVFDNLERATTHSEGADAASLAQGIRMVMKMFGDTVKRMGVERIDTVGKPFDPMVHESIQYEHSSSIEAGLVLAEVQPGYRMGEELLRPALVVVSKGPEPEPTREAEPPADATPAESGNGAADPEGSSEPH